MSKLLVVLALVCVSCAEQQLPEAQQELLDAAERTDFNALSCQIQVARNFLPVVGSDAELLQALTTGADPVPVLERAGFAPADYATALEQFKLCGPVVRL